METELQREAQAIESSELVFREKLREVMSRLEDAEARLARIEKMHAQKVLQ